VAAFHDEDRNGEIKRGLFGRPREGYAFSRNAHAPFGPPDFEDAAITLAPGEHAIITMRMRY
jgi:uncharacterized protein (DUF2141 family)